MIKPLLRALGGTALALSCVFSALSPARAGQTITIPNGAFAGGAAYGNSADGSGNTNDADPNNNILIINVGGTVNGTAYGSITKVAGDATGNTVTISGGMVNGYVYSGYAYAAGDATGNTVTISGGSSVQDVYGGYASMASGNAIGNTVTISGGTVNGTVYTDMPMLLVMPLATP